MESSRESLVALIIMVKNEAPVIEATLKPFVEGGITEYLVYDTGSTDGTPDIAKKYLSKEGFNAHVVCEEFIDFSTSRNRALDLADKLFPTTAFFVMPDAEWYLVSGKGLLDFCRSQLYTPYNCYLIRLVNKAYVLYRGVLLRRDQHLRFKGSVHEWVDTPHMEVAPDSVCFVWNPSDEGAQKSKNRYKRDKVFLLKDYEKDPTNPRTVYYLAQTCCCSEEWKEAFRYFTERTKLKGGGSEEDYSAWYRLAVLTEKIGEFDSSYTWEMAFNCYLNAYNTRPHRSEPLTMIANHYYHAGQPAIGQLFIRTACQLPFPALELLSVEPVMYEYHRFAVYARIAWSMGDTINGERAARLALQHSPNDVGLQELLNGFIQANAAAAASPGGAPATVVAPGTAVAPTTAVASVTTPTTALTIAPTTAPTTAPATAKAASAATAAPSKKGQTSNHHGKRGNKK